MSRARWRAWTALVVVVALLVAVAPAAASSHNPVVVSRHNTDTEFNNAATLDNMAVEGSGSDAEVVLQDTGSNTQSFTTTGEHTYSVAGNTTLTVEIWGAGGGPGSDSEKAGVGYTGGSGGDGGYLRFEIDATGGDTHTLHVGEQGESPSETDGDPATGGAGGTGWFGGGDGGDGPFNDQGSSGGGGGGASVFNDTGGSMLGAADGGGGGGGAAHDDSNGGSGGGGAGRGGLGGDGSTDFDSGTNDGADADGTGNGGDGGNGGTDGDGLPGDDGGTDSDSLVTVEQATAGGGNSGNAQIDVTEATNTDPGTYISQNHSAEQSVEGFVNITAADNVSVTVTWESWDGSSWNQLNQTTVSTVANHTFTWATDFNDTVRVNVTADPTTNYAEFRMSEEGVLANATEPQVDNSSASPTGDLTWADQTLQIDINDSDFPLSQGDSVTVEFFVDGFSVGTDTLTSNGTASTSATFNGGSSTWNVTATDSYAFSNSSQDFTVNVPANLTIRNETSPYGVVTGCTANVRFFETTDDNPVITEVSDSDGDGNVSLSGLPVGSEFVATVKCTGYNNRTVLIEDIFTQSNVFILHQSRDESRITFDVDDRTGQFDDGELVVEKAINESQYNASADGFEWKAIAGDELDAADSFVVILENEDRYRLRVQNDIGDSIILGPYTPFADATERLVVGQVSWVATSGNATVFNASIEQSSTLGNPPPVIAVQFQDPTNGTTNFNYSVFEAGNATNQIDSGSASGTLGTFYAEANISDSEANQKWIVQAQYTQDGETVLERRVVGGASVDIQADQDWLGLFTLVGITSIGLLYGQRTVNVGIVMMWLAAGVAMVFTLITINPAWYAVSGFIVAAAIVRGELR